VFGTDVLVDALRKDAAEDSGRRDMGGNIIPMLVRKGCGRRMTSPSTRSLARPGGMPATGTTSARSTPTSRRTWTCRCGAGCTTTAGPVLTNVPSLPPAKFMHEAGDRVGRAIDSLVSNGVVISGGLVRQSVISPSVRVNGWATEKR